MNAIVGSSALSSIDQTLQRRSICPQQNQLLASLPACIQQSLFPQLEPCELVQGTILVEPGMATSHIYFPVDALVSRHCLMDDGAGTAMSVVGNDGAIDLDPFMGNASAPTIFVVQVAGHAFRIDVRRLKKEMDRHEELLAILSRQSHAMLTQMAQTAVCNRHHTLQQQLCRWLLLALDRLPGDDFRMSLEQIAQALGVERPTVQEAARGLHKAGVVKCYKGRVTLLNREKLEMMSCGCHEVIAREADRLWPAGAPRLDASLYAGSNSQHYH